MSTFDPEAVQELLTPARLGSYRDAVGGDVALAVDLYDWNSEVGSAFFEDLGRLEVVLRNAMDKRLVEMAETGSGSGRRESSVYLLLGTASAIQSYMSFVGRLLATGGALSPGRVRDASAAGLCAFSSDDLHADQGLVEHDGARLVLEGTGNDAELLACAPVDRCSSRPFAVAFHVDADELFAARVARGFDHQRQRASVPGDRGRGPGAGDLVARTTQSAGHNNSPHHKDQHDEAHDQDPATAGCPIPASRHRADRHA